MSASTRTPATRSLAGLDAINSLMAEIRDGVGPYLSVSLLARRHWHPGAIGIARSASSIAAAIGQIPAGLLVDASGAERAPIVVLGLGPAEASA